MQIQGGRNTSAEGAERVWKVVLWSTCMLIWWTSHHTCSDAAGEDDPEHRRWAELHDLLKDLRQGCKQCFRILLRLQAGARGHVGGNRGSVPEGR